MSNVRDLSLCPQCDRCFVQPAEWFEADAKHWHVTLACVNCGWWSDGLYDNATVDAFDTRLNVLTKVLELNLRRLVKGNMAAEVEVFAEALAADQILPEDF